MPVTAEDCRIVILCPFDIHFSQTRIRTEFQDSRLTEETIPEIKVVPPGYRSSSSNSKPPADAPSTAETTGTEAAAGDAGSPDAAEDAAAKADRGDDEYGLGEDCEDLSEEKRGKDFQMLWHPFPRIEVTKWRCKLRELDGSAKIDPVSGLELYSHEERWFSFDNRRLYCLQKAAAAAYPKEVRCEVVEIPPNQARMRELRKFDTRTFGLTVLAGRRDDPAPETWSWRVAIGLPEETQPEEGVARQKSMRWRGGQGNRRGPNSGGGRRRQEEEEDEKEGHGMELMRSALLFFLVYLGLRVVVSVFRHRFGGATAPAGDIAASVIDGGVLPGVLPGT